MIEVIYYQIYVSEVKYLFSAGVGTTIKFEDDINKKYNIKSDSSYIFFLYIFFKRFSLIINLEKKNDKFYF